MDMTFEAMVRRHKAVEWLMMNDPLFRAAVETAKLSPFNTVWVAMEHGEMFRRRVLEVTPRMQVTEQERLEGYPLPKDEAERMQRARVRMDAIVTSRDDVTDVDADRGMR